MRRYSKWPNRVLQAVFHSSPSRISTMGIAEVKLDNKIWARWSGANTASRRGSGYLFLTVISLRESMQGNNEPSFFCTKKNPAPTEEEEG